MFNKVNLIELNLRKNNSFILVIYKYKGLKSPSAHQLYLSIRDIFLS